jgi:uncharacterized protein with PIN domain
LSAYLDTSCVLKLLFPEPETAAVMQLVATEDHVVVSTLARLETITQLHARVVGGVLTRRAARSLMMRLDSLLQHAPYEVVRAPTEALDIAEAQVRPFPREAHCPTLDRLHLAVMAALGLERLLTNDKAQARAARGLGFSVVLPR